MKNKMLKALKKAIKDLPEDKQEQYLKEFENVGIKEEKVAETGETDSGKDKR